MYEVQVSARSMSPFVDLCGHARVENITRVAASMRELLGSHAVWNVSSTAAGGGVAEMLHSLLRYARGLGVDVRWAVLDGAPEFFRVTKRVHNAIHDNPGDGSPLGPDQHALYRSTIDANALVLDRLVRPGDVVVCHDPQTAGLVPKLVRGGVRVVWRCHIGTERPGREADLGWSFLRPYLEDVPLAVFSREGYAPPWIPHKRTIVLPPNIDPFSVKNQWMSETDVRAVLTAAGLVARETADEAVFVRNEGAAARVAHTAEIAQTDGPPRFDVPLVVQVSRWDRMKDHLGVLEAFALLAARAKDEGAELVLAGPMARAVADDPEAPEVLHEIERAWRALPDRVRAKIHLAQLPMEDADENMAIVNALQRHAVVIVQKSLQEGFGLTVTEAMWKGRAIVASAIGGIPDQIRDGLDGILVHHPESREETTSALRRVLEDPALARRLGQSAYERAREHFLTVSALERWAELLRVLVTAAY